MSNWRPKEPEKCACGDSYLQSLWHCPECSRWKPSREPVCAQCSRVEVAAFWQGALRNYFEVESPAVGRGENRLGLTTGPKSDGRPAIAGQSRATRSTAGIS